MVKPLMNKRDLRALTFNEIKLLVKIDAADVRKTLENSTGLGAPVNNTVTLKQILEARPENEHEELRGLWNAIDPVENFNQLSNAALVMCFTYFRYPNQSLKIGGVGAQSMFTDIATQAMMELVEKHFIVGNLFNSYGRIEYLATDRSMEISKSVSMKFLEENSFQPTEKIVK